MTEKYPEHIKLKAIQEKSHAIGDFIFWLTDERNFTLNKPNGMSINFQDLQALLADFFEIDLDKVEKEKVKMLDEIRQRMDVG